MSPDAPILLFDGDCHRCNAGVDFILKHERPAAGKGDLLFLPLAAPGADGLLRAHGLDPDALNSMVLIQRGRTKIKSDAALALTRFLRPPWSWLRVFALVPRPLLDALYDLQAKHRARSPLACTTFTPDDPQRFLERAPGSETERVAQTPAGG